MTNDEQTDLLPWILGVLLLVCGAIASIAMRSASSTPASVRQIDRPPPPTSPASGISQPVAPAAVAAVTPTTDPVSHTLPPGHVWQCALNGQRTYSDAPCGEHPTVRTLHDVNGMTPASSYVSAYPNQPPAVRYDSYPSSLEDAQESTAEPYYSGTQVLLVNRLALRGARPDHGHMPGHHSGHSHP